MRLAASFAVSIWRQFSPFCPQVANVVMIRSRIKVPLSLRGVPKIFLKNDLRSQCSFGSIIGRLNSRINDKCEPVVRAIVEFFQ